MCTPIKGIKGYVLYISLPKFDFKLQIELANLDPTCYLKILISIDPDTLWIFFFKIWNPDPTIIKTITYPAHTGPYLM